MEFDLTGDFWRWPVDLIGHATGNESAIIGPFDANISNLNVLKDTNISDFNILNFSAEANVNLVFISIIAVISITIMICYFSINKIAKLTLTHSNELCREYGTKQERLNVYSRLCGQRLLTYNYNRSYFNSLIKNNNRIEDLIEKMIISNKDLLELIGMAIVSFPGAIEKSVDDFDEITKDILWMRKRPAKTYPDLFSVYKNDSPDVISSIDHFEEDDNIFPELKTAINQLDKHIEDILIIMKDQINMDIDKSKRKHW